MIIVDGFNVYPSEVEGVLYTHPAVRMVAVIGVPDAYHGEVVKACVVPREPSVSIEELKAHCRTSPRRLQGAARDRAARIAAAERGRENALSVLRDEVAAKASGLGAIQLDLRDRLEVHFVRPIGET